MTTTQFYKMPKGKKFGYVMSKVGVVTGIAGASVGAFFASGVQLPTMESKLSFSIGAILIVIIGIIAMLGKIKQLFKVKSIGWIVVFLITWAFSSVATLLVYTLGFVTIPLVIDDLIVSPLWNNYIANTQEE